MNTREIAVQDLHLHKSVANIYNPPTKERVEELAELFKEMGQTTIPKVNAEGSLLTDLDHVLAAEKAGAEIVLVQEININEEEIPAFVIRDQQTPVKSKTEIVREIITLSRWYAKGRGNRTDLSGGPKGSARKKIAALTGMSEAKIQRLQTIYSYDPTLLELVDQEVLPQSLVLKALELKRPDHDRDRPFREVDLLPKTCGHCKCKPERVVITQAGTLDFISNVKPKQILS